MPSTTLFARALACSCVAWVMAGQAHAAAVLIAADARIVFASPTSCTVVLTVSVTGAAEVEHRLALGSGAAVALAGIEGADAVGAARDSGRTRAVIVRPSQPEYTIRYAVTNAEGEAYRCALWLPTVPADGRSRNVQLHVQVPAGAVPGGSMPGFAWTGERGEATLGHLPAFVRVAFAEAGGRPPWDVSRVMDLVTLLVLAVASALWLRRARAASARGASTQPAPAVK
jgi:hypothetical protein